MLPLRFASRRRSPSPSRQLDYTKGRAYVLCDLLTRCISALALITLGVVGWRLQQRVADTRDKVEARERQERRYLPMLRTMTELEIALEAIAADLRRAYPKQTPTTPTMDPATDSWHVAAGKGATALRYAATSLYLPDGEVNVPVLVPRADLGVFGEGTISIPLRAALLMYADWLVSAETFREVPHVSPATLSVDEQRGWIDMRTNAAGFPPNAIVTSQAVDKGALPAWRIWLNTHSVRGNEIPHPFPPRLLEALRVEVAAVVHDTLQRHPDVADRYVDIRSQAIADAARHR